MPTNSVTTFPNSTVRVETTTYNAADKINGAKYWDSKKVYLAQDNPLRQANVDHFLTQTPDGTKAVSIVTKDGKKFATTYIKDGKLFGEIKHVVRFLKDNIGKVKL